MDGLVGGDVVVGETRVLLDGYLESASGETDILDG